MNRDMMIDFFACRELHVSLKKYYGLCILMAEANSGTQPKTNGVTSCMILNAFFAFAPKVQFLVRVKAE